MTTGIDISELQNFFERIAKDSLPKAQAFAVNRAAEYARDYLKAMIPQTFDRPTPFTQNAVMLTTYANKDRPYRDLFLRDEATKGTAPVKYLFPHTNGGPRRLKKMEAALRKIRSIAATSWLVAAKSAALNEFGNVSNGTVAKILSQQRAYSTAGSSKNESAASAKRNSKKARYAVIRGGAGAKPGIYERIGSTLTKRNAAALQQYGVDTVAKAKRALKKAQKFGPVRGVQGIDDKQILARGLKPVYVITEKAPAYTARWPFRQIARDLFTKEFAEQFQLQFNLQTSRFADRGVGLNIAAR